MLIYHGTSFKNLDSILNNGIDPRSEICWRIPSDGKSNWEEYESRDDMVYLTLAYPFYYAACVTENDDPLVVFEIDYDKLDASKLYPDEDYIAQGVSEQEAVPLKEVHFIIRDNIDKWKDLWESSLEKMGNICHKGNIPISYATRYTVVDPKEFNSHIYIDLLDPSICPLNYEIKGEYYRNLVNWFFGDREELPQIDQAKQFLEHAEYVGKDDLVKIQKDRIEYLKEQSSNKKGIEVVSL
jgi:hypothetical protein